MQPRRQWQGTVTLLMLCILLVCTGVQAARSDANPGIPFTIIVLPDTQKYLKYDAPDSRQHIFAQQTQWIADTRLTHNTVFVTHEGDLVDSGGAYQLEWTRADAALDRLDGVVPYATVIGNHDYEVPGKRSSGAASYLRYFGPSRYACAEWYGGASSDGLNSYQFFDGGDWTFLHLALELEARDTALKWAQDILDAHPGMPTIVTTHAYQDDLHGRTTTSEYQGNSGEAIWQEFVTTNDQVFLVLNGHFHQYDGERHQVSRNDTGHSVLELMANYQAYANGGNGYLRVLRFDPVTNTIAIQTYSPTLDHYLTDADSQFNVAVDFTARFGPPIALHAQSIRTTVSPCGGPEPLLGRTVWLPLIP